MNDTDSIKLGNYFEQKDLLRFRTVFPQAKVLPLIHEGEWVCTCSHTNKGSALYCTFCGASKALLNACITDRNVLRDEYYRITGLDRESQAYDEEVEKLAEDIAYVQSRDGSGPDRASETDDIRITGKDAAGTGPSGQPEYDDDEYETEEEYRARKKRNKIITVVLCSVIILVGAVILFVARLLPDSKYKKALSLKEAGRYEEAAEVFSSIRDYKDAADQISECHVLIINDDYEQAIALMNSGDYDEAIEAFRQLDDFEDSEKLIEHCEQLKIEERYRSALLKLEDGSFDEAKQEFEALGEYSDAPDMVKECIYRKACALKAAGSLDEATALYEQIPDYKDSSDNLHEHILAETVTKEPGCTTEGVRTLTCSECGYSTTEAIPAKGHDYTREEIVKAPTCTSAGVIRYYCECGEYTEKTAEAGAHNYTATVTKAASCDKEGVTTYTCPSCGHTYTETVPALGHLFKEATCTAPKTCERCGLTEGSALGHTTDSGVCERCGVSLIDADPQYFDGYLESGQTDTYTVDLPAGTYTLSADMEVENDGEPDDSLYNWSIKIGSETITGSNSSSITRQVTLTGKSSTLKVRICGYYSIVIGP